LLCGVYEVDNDCDFGIDVNDGSYEFSVSGDVLVLEVKSQSGGMSKVDIEKFLKYCSINFPDLYMENVTSDLMRTYT
jgi:hypothetical protein